MDYYLYRGNDNVGVIARNYKDLFSWHHHQIHGNRFAIDWTVGFSWKFRDSGNVWSIRNKDGNEVMFRPLSNIEDEDAVFNTMREFDLCCRIVARV